MFPNSFPNRDKVIMTFEVVEGTRPIVFQVSDDSGDRLSPFTGESLCTLSTEELVHMFNADSVTTHYVGKRRRPRTRFG